MTKAVGVGPAEAELTDRQRVAVVLQATSLLSHLQYAGCRLSRGWRGVAVDRRGCLTGAVAVAGVDSLLVQERLGELVLALFGGDPASAGRGQARRIAGVLYRRWRQRLVAESADRAVVEILDQATFLWHERFAWARCTLAARHPGASGAGLRVAGPGWFRRGLLAGCDSYEALLERLCSADSRRLWEARSPGLVGCLKAARQRYDDGWFEGALALCERDPGAESISLRIRCLLRDGRLRAARSALVRAEKLSLRGRVLLELASSAVAVYGRQGDRARASKWLRRASGEAVGHLRPEVELLAAEAARAQGEGNEAEGHLARARPVLKRAGLACRWVRVAAWRALLLGNRREAIAVLSRFLFRARRSLTATEAASLWVDLADARRQDGDPWGAERGFRHGFRLLGGRPEGAQPARLLAELALLAVRRGREGDSASGMSLACALRWGAGDWEGWAHCQALQGQVELLSGRIRSALDRARSAQAEIARRGMAAEAGELEAVAVRALGWLGRRDDALRGLRALSEAALARFDADERAALWAHAGCSRRALAAVRGQGSEDAWRALLAGQPISAAGWRAVSRLGPLRGARWVFDAALIAPASIPVARRQVAVEALRLYGAVPLAKHLEACLDPPWTALGTYLEEGQRGGRALARLLREAGYSGARVAWTRHGRELVVSGGAGGPARHSAPVAGGLLTLAAASIDPVLRTLFGAATRVFRPPPPSAQLRGERGGIIGSDPVLVAALDRAERLAASDLPVLVTGETGTGKELVARRIHALSSRSGGPFLAVNCAAFSESLLQSELFGHARGAFTGATRDRQGVFEAASGGTLFLDEIGDLPADAQASLLRVLQEGEIRRVGESFSRRVDTRVLAATHRDLVEWTKRGRFRQDLFYRLRVGTVDLPPLRDRPGDLRALCEHFLARVDSAPELSSGAWQRIDRHSWPGNVRELESCLTVGAALTEDGVIRSGHLQLSSSEESSEGSYHRRLREFRERILREALAAARGSQAGAARRLGLSRQALSYLVRRLNLS